MGQSRPASARCGDAVRRRRRRPASPGRRCGTTSAPGLLTVAVTVLVGAPVGLLWAALAPRVRIDVDGDDVQVVDTWTDGFIAVDAWFFAAVVVAGWSAGCSPGA